MTILIVTIKFRPLYEIHRLNVENIKLFIDFILNLQSRNMPCLTVLIEVLNSKLHHYRDIKIHILIDVMSKFAANNSMPTRKSLNMKDILHHLEL